MDEKTCEEIMEAACECCHSPFVVKSQDELNRRCEECPVKAVLDGLTEGNHGDALVRIDNLFVNFNFSPIIKADDGGQTK